MTSAAAAPPTDPIPPQQRRRLRRNLLRWYDRHRRDLPWRRRANDPYAQWVAEIMLQQTRVETVSDYYASFLSKFPTVEALARAGQPSVLKAWEGLGYYRRALHLHEAAKQLFREKRPIPDRRAALRELPGIGDYTSAAIASIAFGEKAAAVDGNVARILARLFGVEEDVLSGSGRRRITALADQLVPERRPGDFNQAWMDLGSLICTPRSPACQRCPLQPDCVAAASGRTAALPLRGRAAGRAVPDVHAVTLILMHGDHMLVRRRPVGGLWSGLWEFPTVELSSDSPPHGATAVRTWLKQLAGPRLRGRLQSAGEVEHVLTHRRYRFAVYIGEATSNGISARASSLRWVDARGFQRLGVSTAHRKIFALLARR